MREQLNQIIKINGVADEILNAVRCDKCRYFQKIDLNVVRTSHCVNSSSPTFADVVPPDFMCGKFTRA